MTAQGSNIDDRQVIPRWRPFKRTVESRELASLQPGIHENIDSELAPLRQTQLESPSLYNAADLFSALVADGRRDRETQALAGFLANLGDLPTPLRSLIDDVSHEDAQVRDDDSSESSFYTARSQVGSSRQALLSGPRNAVRWVDLALAHATLGEDLKAAREIQAALQLSPDSRFVLRAATRFFVHLEDPEHALYVLDRSPRVLHDPWLLAAELSTSQLALGRFRKERAARELLISENLSPNSLSELASELATNEVRSGRDRRARQFFDVALRQPTENAVAQLTALATEGDLRVDPAVLRISRGYEARAISHSRHGEWVKAAAEGRRWHFDQPFALEPALFTSYAASVGARDYKLAFDSATDGLRAHPDNALLHNNAAFALANLGRTVEARKHLNFVPRADELLHSAIHQATLGLVLFRENDIEAGRLAYDAAVRSMISASHPEVATVATIIWALEEQRLRTPSAVLVGELARKRAKESPSPEADSLLGQMDESAGVDLSKFPVKPA